MDKPENYAWQTPYVLAILEPDTAKLIGRIAEARRAIERRMLNPRQIDGPEHLAIQEALKGLAALQIDRLNGSV